MIKSLRNNTLSKVLQVLLIGYFLISSLNLANTIKTVTASAGKECVAWGVFKKMFKCSKTAEEFEDESECTGCGGEGKVKLTVDYLMPGHAPFMPVIDYKVSGKRIFLTETNYSGILYSKIHLPPPELTV
ncbi:hypothetical protein ACLI09_02135 [Flavobacterium sp. RHBU_24]|uniref:hypothetical protein n=1 Tax=Flavobacterium sp. RHBU_24 TaxID=3391185 RepID=UPI003984A6E4